MMVEHPDMAAALSAMLEKYDVSTVVEHLAAAARASGKPAALAVATKLSVAAVEVERLECAAATARAR